MADPILVDIDPIDTWQKVATAKKTGNFINRQSEDQLLFTFVETGNPAPSGIGIGRTLAIDDEAVLNHSVEADFYFYAKNEVAVVEVQI